MFPMIFFPFLDGFEKQNPVWFSLNSSFSKGNNDCWEFGGRVLNLAESSSIQFLAGSEKNNEIQHHEIYLFADHKIFMHQSSKYILFISFFFDLEELNNHVDIDGAYTKCRDTMHAGMLCLTLRYDFTIIAYIF